MVHMSAKSDQEIGGGLPIYELNTRQPMKHEAKKYWQHIKRICMSKTVRELIVWWIISIAGTVAIILPILWGAKEIIIALTMHVHR